jgi:molybdate/tungstate transport system substrate-binding protein
MARSTPTPSHRPRCRKSVRQGLSLLAVGLLCLAPVACKSQKTDVVIFYASSLTAVLGDAAEAFQKSNPHYRLRLEPSGSQVAVRKVSELGMRADIVAVADAGLIPKMMVPSHATWNLLFATNEMVIAHKDHSKWTDQINQDNWSEVLTRDGVRLGRADPDTAPVGYQTLMVWQLAEAAGMKGGGTGGLSSQLIGHCAKEHVTHDEAELLALLESRAVDYAFLFRSTAEDHHLKVVSLAPEINLSRQDLADRYAAARVDVQMKRGQGTKTLTGAPIVYGLTIATNAPHAEAATRFVSFLSGEAGRKLLLRRGFHPISPVACNPCTGLPEQLASATKSPAPPLP